MVQKAEKVDLQRLVFATEPGGGVGIAQSDEMVTSLEQYLQPLVGMPVHVLLGENYEDILAGMERGEIDAARLGPYAFALAQARFDARALVNSVDIETTEGRPAPPYRCMIFTRTASGITHLTQLKGQKVGFVDPHSASGYLVATFLLQQAGLDPTQDIQPVFLFAHRAVIDAVSAGEVIAGAVTDEEFAPYITEHPASALRLLATSQLLSRGPVAIRPGLAQPLALRLSQALQHMHQVDLPAAQLIKLPQQRFVPAVQRPRTLKMVAELAGVSYATVSRAINGRDRIAPETTERILKLVAELGYRPNANARSLHKTRGDVIGLFLPGLRYPALDEIIAGIQGCLDEVHMQLLICPISHGQSDVEQSRQKAYFDLLSNSHFAAVLLTQWSATNPMALELVRGGHASALLEQDLLEHGLRLAWTWLHERGHQRVGLVLGPASWLEPTTTRYTSERLPGVDYQCIEIPSVSDISWQSLEHLLDQPEAPTALLCTDDETALSLRQACAAQERTLPVLGMGQTALTRWAGLPTLVFDGAQLGRAVTQRLLKMLNIPFSQPESALRFWIM